MSYVREALSESPGMGELCKPDQQILKLGISAGFDATQLQFLSTLSSAATCCVPMDLCVWSGSQGFIRVTPTVFIRPKETKIWPYDRRTSHRKVGTGLFCLLF